MHIDCNIGLQNAVIDVFAKRFAPDAVVLHSTSDGRAHLGETNRRLAKSGVCVGALSQLPDVLLHDALANWLYAIDIGRPVTPVRRAELCELISNCSMGISVVSAFADRDGWCKHVDQIAWETAVWIAQEPDHLIYYNGDRLTARR